MPVLLCLSEQMQLRARAVSFPKHIGTQRLCHRYSGAPSASPRISHAGTPYRAAPYWRWEALYTRVPLPEKQAKAWTTNRFPPARPSPYVVHASACSPPTRAGLYVTSPSLWSLWSPSPGKTAPGSEGCIVLSARNGPTCRDATRRGRCGHARRSCIGSRLPQAWAEAARALVRQSPGPGGRRR